MSDFEEQQKLAVVDTIKDGIDIGIKNIVPILINIILWVLTCWIPYLNVGTTIGLLVGIVSKASKGEPIPATEIFDPKYRKYMGEFFLTYGLMSMGIVTATLFLIIPGIVIGIAWSLALLLAVDKGKNPAEAISLSNKCTYGYKFKIVCVYFITSLLIGIAAAVSIAILSAVSDGNITLFVLAIMAFVLLASFIMTGLQASIYRQLTNDVEEGTQSSASISSANVSAQVQSPQPRLQEEILPSQSMQAKKETPKVEVLDEFDDEFEKPKSKAPVIIAVVILALAAIGGAAFFLTQPNTETLLNTGISYYEAEEFANTVEHFSAAIKRKNSVADFYNWRGRAHFELENYDAAIADFREAVRLAPNVAEYRFRMGETLMAMKYYPNAVAAYSEAIKIEPNNALYHFRRGDANNANNAFDASIADYTQAIRLDPSDARFHNNRGGTYRQMENYANAIVDYNEAIRLNPNDARYYNNRGVAHNLNRDYPAAIADYTQAIRLAPDNARYYNNRGQVHSLMRNFAAAAEDFAMALRLDPESEQYRTNLERAQERMMRQQQQFGGYMNYGYYNQQRPTQNPASRVNARRR